MAASDDAEPQETPESQQQQQSQQQHTLDSTPQPLDSQALVVSSAKKPPGTWTPSETNHLIDAYQEKWYALKRGQLRTCHWEEVAESLAARCAGIPEATEKSSVQCRHKLEKLRRRYRAERQQCLRKGPGSSRWPFYDKMDRMERGSHAVDNDAAAAAAAAAAKNVLQFPDLRREIPHQQQGDHDSAMSLDDGEGEDSDQPPPKVFSHRRRRRHHHSAHHMQEDENDESYSPLHRSKHGSSGFDGGPSPFNPREAYRSHHGFQEKPAATSHRPPAPPVTDVAGASEMASVIRYLGEGFLRMEQMKIQMQRESELFRADMELRRTEMVLEAQKQIAHLFTTALMGNKKSKKLQSPDL